MKNTLESIENFFKYISNKEEYISTGYNTLDNLLSGGLSSNLYVIGAMSSVGKTTFSLQMADYIAQSGKSVIIFSIEMTKYELIAKSLSRLSLQSIKNLSFSDIINKENIEEVKELIPLYEPIGNNIYLHDDIVSVDAIENIIKQFIEEKKERPVIIIDYLQILKHDTITLDKQKNDYNIRALHSFSKKYAIPIWVISAFNRGTYEGNITMASFKESGQIEYEADILMSLDAKSKNIVQLSILKNRNGVKDAQMQFNFTPQYSYFDEISN